MPLDVQTRRSSMDAKIVWTDTSELVCGVDMESSERPLD